MDDTQPVRRIELPEWGTKEAWLWGIAHPDFPWHTKESREEYEYPNGRYWRFRRAWDPDCP